jgi:hypothetical protein
MKRTTRRGGFLHRGTAVALIASLLLAAGCGGGMRELEKDELVQPEEAKSFRVTTWDGQEYTFIALHLEGDVLMGTERVTTTKVIGEGEEARETVSNRYQERRIPWDEVEKVEAESGGSRKGGIWIAAVSVAVGVAAFLLLTSDSAEPVTAGGGGK